MEPLYLVDGSGYIFRAYYAIQPLSNSTGLPTNALMGFTRMLAKLIREVNARYIAVTFDTKEPTFRHKLYSEYKANRAECPQDLVPQMPYFRKIVEALGIASLEKPGFEADDIIATLTKRSVALGHPVVIVSGDKDLLQLVSDKVKVLDAMRDIQFTPEAVKEKFGVRPEQMLDYLSLIGDSSDNVPGLKGVGPKSAEKLIEHFGSIEKMVSKSQEIETISGLRGAKSIREKVECGADSLRLSHELIRLDGEVEPYNRIQTVEDFAWTQARSDLLEPLFHELEFTKMLGALQLAGTDAPPVASGASLYAKKRYTIVTSETLTEFANKLANINEFAFDTETSSLDVLHCELFGISISWEREVAYYLPLAGKNTEGRVLKKEVVWELLQPIFANPEIRKVGLNLKFDIEVLSQHGYTVRGVWFDGMLCSHLLHPDRRQNGLKHLAQVHLNERMVTYEDLTADYDSLDLVPLDDMAHYACHDADCSWGLYQIMDPLLGNLGEVGQPSLRRAFQEVEMPLVPVLADIERAGIKVDIPFLEKLGSGFEEDLNKLEQRIHALAGREFNLNSPKQLSVVLFEEMALPTKGVRKNQSGYSTDAGVLSMLSEKHEIAKHLLDYRELHKLNSTYVEALKRLADVETHRVHTSFNQAITATGRLSSTEPNLQNIPIRNPRGRQLRRAFIAQDSSKLLAVDYSQIELRILAHLSGDKNLRQAFIDGEDIHQRTANEIFGAALASPQEKKELRRVAKTINFGIIYGMGAFRLASDLGVSRKQAQEYIDQYFARYPRVLDYFDGLTKHIETQGYVETLFGRRRYQNEIDTSGRDSGYAERSLMNAPIQGSAAEVIKVAMIRLSDALNSRYGKANGQARMVLQVHDELVFEVSNAVFDDVREHVIDIMESAVPLSVPLKVDARSGNSWGEDVC